MKPACQIIFVTVPDNKTAVYLSRKLITEKLCACVNIIKGVESVYKWEGKIETSPEEMLIIKTLKSKTPALIDFVKSHHPYAVAEIIAVDIADGNAPYLKWVKDCCAN